MNSSCEESPMRRRCFARPGVWTKNAWPIARRLRAPTGAVEAECTMRQEGFNLPRTFPDQNRRLRARVPRGRGQALCAMAERSPLSVQALAVRIALVLHHGGCE